MGMLTRVADVAAPGGGGGGAAGAGSSRGAATARRLQGKNSVLPRAPSAKRAADSAGGAKPPAKRRRGAPQERAARPVVLVVPGSPISLALAVADAASVEGAAFRRSRSGTVDRDEEEAPVDPDLGLDPADVEGLAWRDRNRAEAELEASSTQAWVSAATAWARAGKEAAWPEMPVGTVAATTVFVLASEREHGQGGRADMMDLDREVVVVEDGTPQRTDVVEREGADGGGGDTVLEEAARTALEGASRAPASEAPLVVEPQAAPPTEPASVPERAPEKAPASGEAAGGEHALVLRSGGRRVAEPRSSRSGTSEVPFGPPTQEEAAMGAVTRRLWGRTDRI
nr:myristoylated alanine-rich C-kinase substrate-like [Aegilops tauschii subsp. strangulata]